MSGDESRSLESIVSLLAKLRSGSLPSGLILIVVLSEVALADLFPPSSFTTVVSSALALDYQHYADFNSALPDPSDYLPQLEAQLHRVEHQRGHGAFWGGMNPKAGRIVLASVDRGPTRAVLISDPPSPESWWQPPREVILRNHDRFAHQSRGE